MTRYDQLSTYDYFLPDELIAKEPLAERDSSRLLVVDRRNQSIQHRTIRDLPDLLDSGDCLVLNNSRVIPARLFGVRTATGGKWEGLYLGSTLTGNWRLIGQTRGYLRPGETVKLTNQAGESIELQLIEKGADGIAQFAPQAPGTAIELLQRFGTVPLPPYMDRKVATQNDWDRYQTTYAVHPGSVAAPTAGLHFTPELLEACRLNGMSRAEVTLHVGIGTFRPVSVENLSQHSMHTEWCELPKVTADQLNQTREAGGRVVSVGTTSLRTLESALKATFAENHSWQFQEWQGETNIFIHPPYEFHSADAMLTNFHLPKSTLLMLVAAFAGLDFILEAYRRAIEQKYRFYSYGDAMLIL